MKGFRTVLNETSGFTEGDKREEFSCHTGRRQGTGKSPDAPLEAT
jgi:hypothetical protein